MPLPIRRETLPRQARIRSAKAFRRIFALKQRASDRWLTVYVAPNDDDGNRLGLSVSRHFGNAVQRNRIKRLIREAFRRLQHDLPGPADWIVVPKPGVEPQLEDIRQSLLTLGDRLNRKRSGLNKS